QTQVHAPGFFGDALAEAHEQERRAHAKGAAEHGKRHAPQPEPGIHGVHQLAPAGTSLGKRRRPRYVSLASSTTNKMPCSTFTLASGRSKLRWSKPPLALIPPSNSATGNIARGFCAARNA